MSLPLTADFFATPIAFPVAMADLGSPLFWAVLVGWIMTVVLHEFAHGVVGYWGGDYTVAERGGLSLNPLQYIDPVMSLLMPAVFLLIGGVPLPGGVTYIRRDLLLSKWWDSAVSLAGPAMNVLLFVIGAIVLHPRTGWVPADVPAREWTPAQQLVAALTFLQLFAAVLNMLPVPPLDGFGVIGPFLKPETRYKLMTPPVSTGLILVTFVLIMSPAVQIRLAAIVLSGFELLGYDSYQASRVRTAMGLVLFPK
jgi:Zn-dependent protease